MTKTRRKNKNTPNENPSKSKFTTKYLSSVLPLTNNDKIINVSEDEQCLAQLWAGYGGVYPLSVTYHTNRRVRQFIVKHVNPPSSNSSSTSHNRKIRSYYIEGNFYQEIAPIVHELTNTTALQCALPESYSIVCTDAADDDTDSNHSFRFLLSDLRYDFPDDAVRLDERRTHTAIRWLSSFHSIFWERTELLQRCANNNFLWEYGGYWHLQTRLDELEDIDTSSSSSSWSSSALKLCATAIDERMNAGGGMQFKTLCHGDFKKDNLLFTMDGATCAAVDFQYCGVGYGMKDVVMLIVSSVSRECIGGHTATLSQQKEKEGVLLELYREALVENLRIVGRLPQDRLDDITEEGIRGQYELALIDYVRFMAGWGFWGVNCEYATNRVQDLLQHIAGSCDEDDESAVRSLSSEQWKDAIYKYYPT